MKIDIYTIPECSTKEMEQHIKKVLKEELFFTKKEYLDYNPGDDFQKMVINITISYEKK